MKRPQKTRLSLGFILALAWFAALPLLHCQAKNESPLPPQGAVTATLAGGCFWCIEAAFKDIPGVYSVTSGYAGGDKADPSYEEVSSGTTGHVEAVQIVFDPKKINFEQLLEVYWRQINPTDAGGQFVDRGPQYQAIIFYHNEAQKETAEKSKAALAGSGRFEQPILTPIRPFKNFYPAEDYHQGYFRKNPLRYKLYKSNSGRNSFVERFWKDITGK